jgi:hypothetical protein
MYTRRYEICRGIPQSTYSLSNNAALPRARRTSSAAAAHNNKHHHEFS